MDSNSKKLASLINSGKKMVFFGGAGLSTESGIPDFRSAQGLFRSGQRISPERIVSHSYFMAHPDEFYDFYREKIVHLNAQPNPAHYALAELERRGVLQAIITQNVDGLHQAAGSKQVIELHGSIYRNYCIACNKRYPVEFVMACEGVPHCESCGSLVRPDVVLYEEALNESDLAQSIRCIEQADLLMVGGTSLAVYPAAGLVDYFKGDAMIVINKDPAAFDRRADVLIEGPIGEVLGTVVLGNSTL